MSESYNSIIEGMDKIQEKIIEANMDPRREDLKKKLLRFNLDR